MSRKRNDNLIVLPDAEAQAVKVWGSEPHYAIGEIIGVYLMGDIVGNPTDTQCRFAYHGRYVDVEIEGLSILCKEVGMLDGSV